MVDSNFTIVIGHVVYLDVGIGAKDEQYTTLLRRKVLQKHPW